MELTYENMMAVAKKYCDILPGLIPATKHEMEAILIPDYVGQSPEGEADHVSSHYKTYRAYLYYEPFPLYIIVDDRKKMADCILREDARHPMTGELVKAVYKEPGFGVPDQETVYMNEHFEFTLHENAVKIKNVFASRINPDSVAWQRFRDLAKHPIEGKEKELTYENMMAVAKKYCDLLPGLIPATKHEMEAILTPDYVGQNPEGEADHVSSHWETYRAYLYYEPWPMYIIVDDRKKMADCILKEEARHPATGELVKVFKNPLTGEMEDTIYMCEHFEFALHDGQVKIQTVFSQRINPDSPFWHRFRDLARH